MERTILALSLGFGLLTAPLPGHANPRPCAPHDVIASALQKQYGEEAHAMGLAEDATVMELYAAPQTGTWTLTVTRPDGMTCLVATGRNFESIAPVQVSGDPA